MNLKQMCAERPGLLHLLLEAVVHHVPAVLRSLVEDVEGDGLDRLHEVVHTLHHAVDALRVTSRGAFVGKRNNRPNELYPLNI